MHGSITIRTGPSPDSAAGPQTIETSDMGGSGQSIPQSRSVLDAEPQPHASGPSGAPAAPPPPPHAGGLTFTTEQGMPLMPHEVRPDSLVTLPNGEQWSLGALLSTGEVVQAPGGGYQLAAAQQSQPQATPEVTTQGAQPADAAERPADQADPEVPPVTTGQDTFSEASEAALSGLIGRAGADVVNDAIEGYLAEGDLPDRIFSKLTDRFGGDQEAAIEATNAVEQAYMLQAREALSEVVGEDLVDQVVEHLHQPGQREVLRQAINSQITGRSLGGYRQAAATFLAGLAESNPDLVLGAQFADPELTVSRDPSSGEVLLSHPSWGSPTTWRAAFASGLVKLGG